MFKSKYLILLLLLFSGSIFGQSKIGIKGGINRSHFYDSFFTVFYNKDCKAYNKYLFSFVYKETKDKENIGLELQYKAKSAIIEVEDLGLGRSSYDSIHYYLNYIDLYLLVGYNIIEKKNINIYCNFTSYIGCLVNSKAVGKGWYSSHYTDSTGTTSYKVNRWKMNESPINNISKIEIGIGLSFGISIPIGDKYKLFAENSFSIGLLPIKEIVSFTNTVDITFSIGILYKLDNFSLNL